MTIEIDVDVAAPASLDADVVAVPVTQPADQLPRAAAELDERLRGRLARLVADGEVTADAGESVVVHLDDAAGPRRVATAGVGPAETLDSDTLRTSAAAVARNVAKVGGTIGWLLDESLPLPLEEQARAIVDGTVLGAYRPSRWKTNANEPRGIDRLAVCTDRSDLERTVSRTATVARWTNIARDLVNAPPNELTPEELARRAAEIAEGAEHLHAEALGPERLEELGMGAFLAVASGSENEPRLIVLRYEPPAAQGDVHLGLVGKAITFDSGGISLKPALLMESMKGDMAGGAAVVAGMGAIAELGAGVRATAVVAACENLPGGASFRPGDILTAANGKTIEVINTDAEGRLVLADALWYAREQGATHVLDLATLTGAMELALGDLYAGLFANDGAWRDEIIAASKTSGDLVWPWPLHPRYRRYIDSTFADMKNASILKQGSPVLAAEFLREFAGEGAWAHIDMAGPGFFERSRGDYLTQPGGTGFGVRLIADLAQRLS